MSEHKFHPTSGDLVDGISDTETGTPSEMTAEPMKVESPKLAPDVVGNAEAGRVEASKIEAPKIETPKIETPKIEAPKVEMPKPEAPRPAGKIMIMARSRDHSWSDEGKAQDQADKDHAKNAAPGKRRVSAIAAVIALAAVAGALGGALATAGIGHLAADDGSKVASLQARALEDSIMRIDADIAALKKQSVAQAGKFNDRFDKVEKSVDRAEKAQAEPAAKLARLSDAVDKLKAAPAPAPQPVAAASAKEVTGSIQAPVPTPAPKPEIARLPTVEGWVLRDVADGGAMIEGRQGIYEVYAGDPVPGLGRVDAIRKQDGRWVVVTSKGLIIAR